MSDVDRPAASELWEWIHHGPRSGLYERSQYEPIRKNLLKKFNKGVYDHTKAAKLWRYLVDRAALDYATEHGDRKAARYIFSGATRNDVAVKMADQYRDTLGPMPGRKNPWPRKRRHGPLPKVCHCGSGFLPGIMRVSDSSWHCPRCYPECVKHSNPRRRGKNPRHMTMRAFLKEYRAEIDAHIRRMVPNIGTINDAERRQWIANDEGLYNWARSEGVSV